MGGPGCQLVIKLEWAGSCFLWTNKQSSFSRGCLFPVKMPWGCWKGHRGFRIVHTLSGQSRGRFERIGSSDKRSHAVGRCSQTVSEEWSMKGGVHAVAKVILQSCHGLASLRQPPLG